MSPRCLWCDAELGAGCAALLCRPCVARLRASGPSRAVQRELYARLTRVESLVTNLDTDATLSDVFPAWLAAHRPPGDAVLEVGCGGGYLADAIRRRGFRRVLGSDVDVHSVAVCRRRFPELEFLVADARALPLPSGSVDVIVSVELLEHLLDAEDHLREAARVLRPGGALLLRTPNRLAASLYYRLAGRYDMAVWHPSTFSARSLAAALHRHGFRVEHLAPRELPRSQQEKLPRAARFLARVPLGRVPLLLRPSILCVATLREGAPA